MRVECECCPNCTYCRHNTYTPQNKTFQLTAIQKLSDEPLVYCPECNEASLKKLISAAAFRLKGSGWYETDFKTGNKKNIAKSDNETQSSVKPDKKENIKLIKYQNFLFTFGKIYLFEIVINIKEQIDIKIALKVPKIMVVNSLRFSFIRYIKMETKKPNKAPIIEIYNQSF